MYEAVANYFKGDPDVVGYELMNEPWPGSPWVSTVFGSPAFDTQELTPFYNQVDSAIRAVDPSTPVYFEPNTLFNEGIPTHLGTVNDQNTVFAFHNYCGGSQPVALCPQLDDMFMDNAAAYAGSHDIPAFITEFGSANGNQAITDTLNAADQHQYGWLEWSYNGIPAITGTSPEAALLSNPEQPPVVGENVDAAHLATLAEPYPQAIAGTPSSWSFDSDTGTFQLSYSTEKVDGTDSFAAGSQTIISTPKIEYPDGYQVTVTGGHVASDPNAPELVIASNAGASTVTVTVSPAGASSAG
jgi:endoglycosylceramidase